MPSCDRCGAELGAAQSQCPACGFLPIRAASPQAEVTGRAPEPPRRLPEAGSGAEAPEIRPFAIPWQLISRDWMILGSYWGTMLLLALGMGLLSLPFFVVIGVGAATDSEKLAVPALLTGPITFVLLLWYVGFVWLVHQRLLLAYLDCEPLGGWGAIRECLPRLGAQLLTTLIMFGASLLSCTIILMPWAMGYMMVAITALAEGLPMREAHARGQAQGSEWLRWLFLLLGEIVISILGSLACGVGLILAYPIGYMAPVVIYREQYPKP